MNLKDSNNNVKCNFLSSLHYDPSNNKAQVLNSNRSLVGHVMICYACSKPIIDQYLHNILDKYWHIQCLRCTDCEKQLSGRCFEKDGKLFCSLDYKRRVCNKCSVCLNIILPNELVRHSKDSSVFHLKCFYCVICQKQLSTGDEYSLLDNLRPVCKEDFQNIFKQIKEISEQRVENNDIVKKDIECCKKEVCVNDQKEVSNPQSKITKDIIIFKEDKTSLPNSSFTTSTMITEINKFPFSDILNVQKQSIERVSYDLEHISCQQNQIIGPIRPEYINSEALLQQPIVSDESQQIDIKSKSYDNSTKEAPPLLIQEKPEKFPLIISCDYDKDQEVCSLDDDLKSSFSVPSSPISNIKEEEQDGNVSDQTFQDDQQSICHTESREGAQSGNSGTKRRGPRTTIKAKQLDTLKAAFAATPKPTRHVREQLAQDTGLTMRVIQVWFQNRRSKERRMKQLSAMGARRPFFRNTRRMRSLSRGFGPEDMINDGGQMMNNPQYHGYFGEGPEFCNAIATLGGSFPSINNYPLGHPAIHREFFLPNHNSGIQQSFINLSQSASLQSSIQLPSSESNQSIIASGPLENSFNSNEHFTSTHCNSPDIQFPQPNFCPMSSHNLLPGPGYLCGPQITSSGISRPLSIQNLSSLNFVQAPMIGMESW